ncbi:hypothetical protein C6P42_000370 [Pichia californica]|nr:hypothetical protein C6P42_000370 [[Candida] californica]
MFTLYSHEGYFDFQLKIDADAKYEIDYFDSIPSFISVDFNDTLDYMEGNWIVDWDEALKDDEEDENEKKINGEFEYDEYVGIAELFAYSVEYYQEFLAKKSFNEDILSLITKSKKIDLLLITSALVKNINWNIETCYDYINNYISNISKEVVCMSIHKPITYNKTHKLGNHPASDYCYGCHDNCKVEWLDGFDLYEENLVEERYLDDVYTSECSDSETVSLVFVDIKTEKSIVTNNNTQPETKAKTKKTKKAKKHSKKNFRHSQCSKKSHK